MMDKDRRNAIWISIGIFLVLFIAPVLGARYSGDAKILKMVCLREVDQKEMVCEQSSNALAGAVVGHFLGSATVGAIVGSGSGESRCREVIRRKCEQYVKEEYPNPRFGKWFWQN